MKEIRETRGIVLSVLALYCLLIMSLVHSWHVDCRRLPPFVEDEGSFYTWFIFLTLSMAIGLGLRQTLGESVRGSYPFLLHRPAGRRWLIGVKLLVGGGLYLACSAVPILAYALWAATPGTHPSPFDWSMTAPAWYISFGMTSLYLGAFLTGIRPGRWYRSRILPMAAALFLAYVAAICVFALGPVPELWAYLTLAVFDVWMIAMILFVARTRDYP